MKFIIKLILLIAVAILIAFMSHNGHGHVIAFVGKYRLDISLGSVILGTVLLFICSYGLIRIVVNVMHIPSSLSGWWRRRETQKSHKYLTASILSYFSGNYKAVYKYAMRATSKESQSDDKVVTSLLAFLSLGHMGQDARQQQLEKQLDGYQDASVQVAILVVRAINAYRKGKFGACIDLFGQILIEDKKHVFARYMLMKTYIHLNEYAEAYSLLQWLVKSKVLRDPVLQEYQIKICSALFATADLEMVCNVYKQLGVTAKTLPALNQQYLLALLRLNEYKKAIKFLQGGPKNTLYPESIQLAKKLTDGRLALELLNSYDEQHIAQNKHSALLFLLLGILEFNLQHLDAAQKHLEASIALAASTDGYLYLCFVARQMDNQELHASSERFLLEHIQGNLNT